MSRWAPTLAFAGFAFLLAGRDILSELYLAEDAISLAFLNCATIAVLSAIVLLCQRQWTAFYLKMKRPEVYARSLILGISASVVYGVTFYMIKTMGAGLFDLIDYGLAPILTAGIGIFVFRDHLRPEILLSVIFYLVGIAFLKSGGSMVGWNLILVALASPVATAASDGLTKWLLAKEGGNLTRSELLFVRFVPASLVLAMASPSLSADGIHFNHLERALPVAVIFGFGPLWLLCTALGRKGLTELAMWEFIIPGLAFFGTLHARWEEHGSFIQILGACLVISALLVGESKVLSRILERKKRKAEHPVRVKPYFGPMS